LFPKSAALKTSAIAVKLTITLSCYVKKENVSARP